MAEITDPREYAAMALANRAPGSYSGGIPQLAPLAPPSPADVEAAQQRALMAQQPIPQAAHTAPAPSIADMVRKQEAEAAAAAPPPGPRSLADVGGQRQGPPIIAPQYRPGGWTPGPETKQFEYGMAPEELDAAAQRYKTAITHAENAADAGYKAAEFKAKNDAYYQATRQAEEQKYAQERAALLAAKQAKIDESLADLAARSSAVANAKVNPEQFWEGHGGALGSVLAAIAVGMGQYSASRTGGSNAALGIINGAIDKNIAAQRDNMENNKAGLAAANSLYAQNLAAFGDKESALLATKVNYLEQAKAFMEQQAALNEGSARAMENKENMLAKADNQIGDLNLKLAQLGHTREAFSSSRHYSPGGMVGGVAAQKNDSLWVTTGPNGEGYRARTDKEAEQGRALEEAYQEVSTSTDKAKKTRKGTNWLERLVGKVPGFETEDVSTLEGLSAQGLMGVKKAETLGALDKGAEHVGTDIYGNFASVLGNPEAKADSYRETLRERRDAFRRAQAGLVRQQTIEQTPRGDYAESSVGLPKLNHPNKIIKTNKIGSK